ILKPKCLGGHFEYHVTRRHIDACEELQDKSLVISSKFQKMGSCGRIIFIYPYFFVTKDEHKNAGRPFCFPAFLQLLYLLLK
ncbi:MAG: hypothetical protein N2489_00260, partial [Clostridia bacterium]|nr:hypothetical protein [Clostridia bacterium]